MCLYFQETSTSSIGCIFCNGSLSTFWSSAPVWTHFLSSISVLVWHRPVHGIIIKSARLLHLISQVIDHNLKLTYFDFPLILVRLFVLYNKNSGYRQTSFENYHNEIIPCCVSILLFWWNLNFGCFIRNVESHITWMIMDALDGDDRTQVDSLGTEAARVNFAALVSFHIANTVIKEVRKFIFKSFTHNFYLLLLQKWHWTHYK